MDVEYGFCHCGCGRKTPIATKTEKRYGAVKGEPRRFIKGHKGKYRRTLDTSGYVTVHAKGHPRTDCHGYVKEHIIVVERHLGIQVTKEMEIHHINGDRADNRIENLVLCANSAEHKKLHQEQRAIEACGHADWRLCRYCKAYSPIYDMRVQKNKTRSDTYYHLNCHNKYTAALRALKRQSSAPVTVGEGGLISTLFPRGPAKEMDPFV